MLHSATVSAKRALLMSRRLKGVAAAPGIAIAPLVHFHMDLDFIPMRAIAREQIPQENLRLEDAIKSVSQSIQFLRHEIAPDLSHRDASIYDAQLTLLHDPQFKQDLLREIDKDLINVEVALQRVITRYEQSFEAMQDA